MIDCIEKGSNRGQIDTGRWAAEPACGVDPLGWRLLCRNCLTAAHASFVCGMPCLRLEKNLHTDYTNIESRGGREKNKRAMEFYRSYYSGSADFLDACNQFCVCIVGVVSSLLLIYKINPVMILLILATCACEFFFARF